MLEFIVLHTENIDYEHDTQPEGTAFIPGMEAIFNTPDGGIVYDNAYPWLMKVFLSPGLLGLVTAALAAAIISSLARSEEHTSELQSRGHLVCRLLLEKKK